MKSYEEALGEELKKYQTWADADGHTQYFVEQKGTGKAMADWAKSFSDKHHADLIRLQTLGQIKLQERIEQLASDVLRWENVSKGKLELEQKLLAQESIIATLEKALKFYVSADAWIIVQMSPDPESTPADVSSERVGGDKASEALTALKEFREKQK